MATDSEVKLIRILCTGVESSGTKLCTDLLRKAGADAIHSSPNHRRERGDFPNKMRDFDAVVLVVRNWFSQNRSAVENGHAMHGQHARELTLYGLSDILYGLRYGTHHNFYVVTYESLTGEPRAFGKLCEALGLEAPELPYEVGNANAKDFGGETFTDQRGLHERH